MSAHKDEDPRNAYHTFRAAVALAVSHDILFRPVASGWDGRALMFYNGAYYLWNRYDLSPVPESDVHAFKLLFPLWELVSIDGELESECETDSRAFGIVH